MSGQDNNNSTSDLVRLTALMDKLAAVEVKLNQQKSKWQMVDSKYKEAASQWQELSSQMQMFTCSMGENTSPEIVPLLIDLLDSITENLKKVEQNLDSFSQGHAIFCQRRFGDSYP
ncbi:hypothetical protein N0V85_002433 [Neurospora sp. IMI 360204]|nr:hypothetical protein N0V85_002433 [Neurospora sp. IMI 360204]